MSGAFVRQWKPPEHVCTEGLGAGGKRDDLWRCECGALWRLGHACLMCDLVGPGNHVRAQCVAGNAWRPATLWQRIRNWRRSI